MKPYTKEDANRIREILDAMPHLAVGIGDRYSASSMTAINLGLDGTLTDKTPDCMSEVIGAWLREINYTMYDTIRDSREWRELLPLAAGTGRDHEQERLDLVMAWMWEDVLPQLQPMADAQGFGRQWRHMIEARTEQAAWETKAAANEAEWAAAWAAWAVNKANEAAWVADEAEWAAAWAVESARAASRSAHGIPDFWVRADPIGLLRRLIDVNTPKWETEE